MFGWIDSGKRKFFALLMVLIVVEIVVVVLMALAEHRRFSPINNKRLRVGKIRPALASVPGVGPILYMSDEAT